MAQKIQSLLRDGVDPKNIMYLNFFDDRLHSLRLDDLGNAIEAYFLLYPEKKNSETTYCFFDEIQRVQGWDKVVPSVNTAKAAFQLSSTPS
jgi:predicted AAA+ superfamily ATPase